MKRLTNRERIVRYGDPQSSESQARIVFGRATGGLVVPKLTAHRTVWVHMSEAVAVACASIESEQPEGFRVEMQAYNVRRIRGGSSAWSLHSWALAWDCFTPVGPVDRVTGRHRPPDAFYEALEGFGFVWGARFSRPDPHHVEWPW